MKKKGKYFHFKKRLCTYDNKLICWVKFLSIKFVLYFSQIKLFASAQLISSQKPPWSILTQSSVVGKERTSFGCGPQKARVTNLFWRVQLNTPSMIRSLAPIQAEHANTSEHDTTNIIHFVRTKDYRGKIILFCGNTNTVDK